MRLTVFFLAAAICSAQDQLPGTTKFTFPDDIAAEQYAELRAFYEKQHRDVYQPIRDPEAARAKLRELIGAVDSFSIGKVQIGRSQFLRTIPVSLVEWPISRIGTIGSTAGSSASQVRQYGLLFDPPDRSSNEAWIAIADADEQVSNSILRLARKHLVYVPLFTRRAAFSQPWLEDRQWLVRLAYQTGRHLIGSEVQQVMLAREWLAQRPGVSRVSVYGAGQGGLTALLAGAFDAHFASVSTVRYLDDATPEWDQPEDRILWSWRRHFRPADLSALFGKRLTKISPEPDLIDADPPVPNIEGISLARVANHQFAQWQAYYRNLAIEATRVRESRWKPDYSSPAAYEKSVAPKREAYFDMIGRYPAPVEPLTAESVLLYDEPEFRGWRLSVKVYDGVHAYGILLVPKNIRPGEKRPTVFVQHGLAGKPEDSLGVVPNDKADNVYSRFGWKLARRGYIVFAPMIATQDNAERTKLIRRAHPVGMIPAGMDVRKFGRVLDYLSTLPYVDKDRFAFYGLSYGGYTALWIGPGEPRFKVVISSGHYNDWAVKTTDLTLGTAYPLYFNVFDQYNFGMLNGFNHSDLASLIAPRAFMVEMGDSDSVIVEPRALADAEIDRALDVYRKLRIPTKGACARFHGPHKIDGAEAFLFLDRWLNFKPAAVKFD